ncbi:MAG: phage tail tape measure protein, partial [Candidatus Thorarchaeota archaeon]
TLAAEDATEALTAAVKIYGQEGESTIRFLDAWTEVESRHAITSKNLALALRKSAAAAKTAGVTFDQLNAIITGIGETTRQTGNEIGTSLRFIFRRLYSKKAPQMLETLGIPVIGETGELRSAFDILGDLADKWSDLTKVQRLSIATAIGGRRHYNSVIVLMEHWNDVLNTLTDSINSKGAAERRNAIIMETYAKKVQQLRAAVVELQLQFGKYALPIATKFVNGMRYLIESISNISPAIKIATAALGGFFLVMTKGQGVINKLTDYIKSFGSMASLLKGDFMKKLGTGIFEVFGKVPKVFNVNVTGLKVIGESAKSIRDLETVLGKAGYILAKFGRIWNDVLSTMAQKGVSVFEAVGKVLGWLGKAVLRVAEAFGFSNKLLTGIFATMSAGLKSGEKVFYSLAKAAGVPAVKFQEWAQTNSTFIKSFGPLAATIAAVIPVYGKLSDTIKRVTFSAEGYEKSLSGVRRKQSSELQTISDLAKRYNNLENRLKRINKLSAQPITKALAREEYVSPVLQYDKLANDYIDFANEIAKTTPDLVLYFDKFGNAVLKSGYNFKEGIELMRKAKLSEMADTSIKALEKFAEELTNAGTFSAKFRSELKKFIKEVPAAGPILSKFIQVSPAQELKEAVDSMNQILAAKLPLSPAFDKLFNQYYDQLIKARKRFREAYKRFGEILSELPPGLSPTKVTALLDREIFKPMYEMIIQQRRSLQQLAEKGIIDWRDILGIQVLRTLHPERQLDFAGVLTKEMARQAKIIERKGEVFAGDTVIFMKDIDKYMKVAGQQGIVKFREGLGWFVEVFDKELRQVREVPLDAVEQFIDSVFPAHRMIEAINRNLDILKENLTGAAAGMVGITQQEFRKLYNLGPRFFENIPTEVLMQTGKGINITTGTFGKIPFKETFAKDLKKYFFDPLDQLNQLTEPLTKRLGAQAPLSKGLEEQINKLQKLISNNQIYVQLIRTYAELEKTIARITRTVEENIAVEKERFKVLEHTAGLLKGLPENLKDIDYGIQNIAKLSIQQRAFVRELALPPEKRVITE